jgi:hypothetical protein
VRRVAGEPELAQLERTRERRLEQRHRGETVAARAQGASAFQVDAHACDAMPGRRLRFL